MNALLRIQVQVAAREAQAALRQLSSTINQVSRSTSVMGRGGGGGTAQLASGAKSANIQLTALGRLSQRINGDIDRSRMGMIQLGKNMQWVGRQINFNFTIPLLLAGRAALKWELESERAFTRIRKVYGESGQDYTDELDKIGVAIRMLSDFYGVNRAEVTELAAQWAAAGVTGAALAESVKNSLDLSILGDYENLGDIFNQLITIQSAYKLNSEQLKTAIADLNTVENMTAATLPDLVTAIAKAGSSAELAGVDFQHLAAFTAALVPATGSAANAGNSLKTIFSRLAKPTTDINDALQAMGINLTEFANIGGEAKLELMAERFVKLTDSQQAFIASSIGGRWQVNKFSAIMKALADETSNYKKVLDAIDPSREGANIAAAAREIDTLLKSDPRRLQILTNSIKNLMADAIAPAIPFIITIVGYIRALFEWFNNLDPTIKKVVVGFLLLTAAVGIVAQMLGSFKLLFGTAIEFLIWVATLIPGVGTSAVAAATTTAAAVTAAEAEIVAGAAATQTALSIAVVAGWAIAAAAVVALIIVFRKQIADGINNVIRYIKQGFNSLPQSIQNALLAVARIVATIIKTIIHWLSYLNPFARHSPSLVDNVTAGVEAILGQYARLNNVAGIFRKAASDLAVFASATAAAVSAARDADRMEIRAQVTQVSPDAGPALDEMFANVDSLSAMLAPLNAAIGQQQQVVDKLKAAYDAASKAVDRFDASLEPLREMVDSLKTQMDAATSAINDYASTNITGMKAADDAIFGNEMAQKKLRLEILRMEEAGKSYEDVREQIAALNADIESTRATMTDLRAAGAGSDILSVYQDQLDSLEAQKSGLEAAAANGADLQKQLEDLQRTGEILDLERSLNFDPLLRQIDDLAHATEEMSFDQIIAGITEQKAKLVELTASYDIHKASLDQQEQVLKTLQAERDKLRDSYDAENETLTILKESYAAIEDQIRAITEAINEAVAAQKTLTAGAGSGGGGAGGGGGPAFEDLAGEFDPTTLSGDLGTMQQTIDQWIEDMKKQFGDINLDPFAFFRKAWDKLQTWWNGSAVPFFKELPGMILDFIAGGDWPDIDFGGILEWFSSLGEKIGGFLEDTWDEIGPHITQFADLFDPLVEAWGHTFTVLKQVVNIALKIITTYFGPAFAIIMAIVGPAWNLIRTMTENTWNVIKGVVKGALDIVYGIIKTILSLINGDWGAAWDGVVKILEGAWTIITTILGGVVTLIVGVVTALVEAVGNLGEILLGVGKAIIQGIWDGMVWVWDLIIGWIGDTIQGLIDTVKNLFGIASPSSVMMDIGIDVMTGMLNGLIAAAVFVWNWFIALPGVILGYLATALTWLVQKGSDILTGLGTGIINGAVAVWDWFMNLDDKILGYLLSAGVWLLETGRKLLGGLFDGIVEVATTVWNWFMNLGATILGFVVGAGDWLYNTGLQILQGLWEGLRDKWAEINDWLVDTVIGGLKGAFKVPFKISSPSQVFKEYGQMMMEGLRLGLEQGFAGIPRQIDGMVSQINSSMYGLESSFTYGMNGTAATSMPGISSGIGQPGVMIFNGDLSFPNITDPADADEFIKNLEVLAESRS